VCGEDAGYFRTLGYSGVESQPGLHKMSQAREPGPPTGKDDTMLVNVAGDFGGQLTEVGVESCSQALKIGFGPPMNLSRRHLDLIRQSADTIASPTTQGALVGRGEVGAEKLFLEILGNFPAHISPMFV
jgi:hypothetical protein